MSSKKKHAFERHLKQLEQHKKCCTLANERFSEEEFNKIKQANKGLYFLPIRNSDGEIQKMALMKPMVPSVFRICQIAFIKAAMRECFVGGDKEVFEDDDYFTQAEAIFMEALEGRAGELQVQI